MSVQFNEEELESIKTVALGQVAVSVNRIKSAVSYECPEIGLNCIDDAVWDIQNCVAVLNKINSISGGVAAEYVEKETGIDVNNYPR